MEFDSFNQIRDTISLGFEMVKGTIILIRRYLGRLVIHPRSSSPVHLAVTYQDVSDIGNSKVSVIDIHQRSARLLAHNIWLACELVNLGYGSLQRLEHGKKRGIGGYEGFRLFSMLKLFQRSPNALYYYGIV